VTEAAWKRSTRQDLELALADLPVHRVGGRRLDAYADLPTARLRKGDLLDVKFLGSAVAMILDALHVTDPMMCCWRKNAARSKA
jgi:hypothetical protein